jgi:hypothetical protein
MVPRVFPYSAAALRRLIVCVPTAVVIVAVAASPAVSQLLPGDLDGDGTVGATDEAVLGSLYGAKAADPNYEPSADLNADGRVDVGDLALFGTGFGASGGATDRSGPGLFATLNHIPDNMNDLIVVPPEGFQITLDFSSTGESAIDTASLVVTSNLDIGPHPAGTDLGGEFTVSASEAVWEIPPGSDLARTTHGFTASIRDLAGNETTRSYEFAVRDFAFGAPLANLQTIYLDFEADRGNGTFLEDLREFGLTSPFDPDIEALAHAEIVAEIVRRVHRYYGLDDDGTPGTDSVNILFHSEDPGVPATRICVGGSSPQSAATLGSANLDVHNLDEFSDECAFGQQFGIFPQAIDNLWGGDPGFVEAFDGVDPDLGGTPFGEHVLDPTLLAPGFKPAKANLSQIARLISVLGAVNAFAQIVATAIAHETGHTLGLTAPGDAPGGLFGGTSGARLDHNVTAGGGTPNDNYLMNNGGSFTFDEITGSGSKTLPIFRPLNWAYLTGRVALNAQVTGLYPPPALTGVTPNPAGFPQGQTTAITLDGEGFLAPALVELHPPGGGIASPVFSVIVVDSQTLAGTINKFLVAPDTYDVRIVNGDGQETTLPAGLVVQ